MNNASNWASLEMKKNPWWRDDMSPEEYDAEREFYVKNFDYPEKPLKYKHIRRISD